MIVFWIIGLLFLVIGLIFSLPTFIKIFKYKGHTTGKIVRIDSTDQNARAVYEYAAAGSKYTNKTNWTSNCMFQVGKKCHVFYDKQNPNHSYIRMSGQYIRCFVGTIFAILGLVVLFSGIFLNRVL
ncbi:MAG TPA: DUF3592 domain-containing protein [Candidatus Anaerostipes avistercoris]|uniref:DUF3592 domain-containing protein n=1 Tax=Candidatus Anaerostipes avistercoris TaxID=2838462 RepID=A0A9D2T8V1_9FIRM|nr:DUF3592 domain-containing protein [Candidatus Anaerostipes avistercoris]